jgi:hypothetical protein
MPLRIRAESIQPDGGFSCRLAGLTKPEAAPEKSSSFSKLIGDFQSGEESPIDYRFDRTGV